METIEQIEARAEALSDLVTEKFGVQGATLAQQARKLGRCVPKSVRQDLTTIGIAAQHARQPKSARLHQPTEVSAAAQRAVAYLNTIDPKDRRRGALLSWLGGNALTLLMIGGGLVAVMRLRGLV